MSEWAIRSKIFGLKNLKSYFLDMFYIGFLFKKWVIGSFPHFWWAMWANCTGRSPKMSDVSESLSSLTKNERPWANEGIARFLEQIAHSLIFSQKTSDSLRKLMSEFPALPGSQSPALSTHSKIKIGAAGSIFPLESKFAVTEKEN